MRDDRSKPIAKTQLLLILVSRLFPFDDYLVLIDRFQHPFHDFLQHLVSQLMDELQYAHFAYTQICSAFIHFFAEFIDESLSSW